MSEWTIETEGGKKVIVADRMVVIDHRVCFFDKSNEPPNPTLNQYVQYQGEMIACFSEWKSVQKVKTEAF